MNRRLLYLLASLLPLIPITFFYFRSQAEADFLPSAPCDSVIDINPYWPLDFALYDSTHLIISARDQASQSSILLLKGDDVIALYSDPVLKIGGICIKEDDLFALHHGSESDALYRFKI